MIAAILHSISLMLGYKEKPKTELPAWERIPIQTNTERIIATEIKQILSEIENLGINPKFANDDREYKLVNIDNLKKFVADNNLARYVYVKEKKDCDDFMRMMSGDTTHWDSDLAVGEIRGWKPNGKGHAWNWCISTDKELWFIEPQTNIVFKPKDFWKITKLEM